LGALGFNASVPDTQLWPLRLKHMSPCCPVRPAFLMMAMWSPGLQWNPEPVGMRALVDDALLSWSIRPGCSFLSWHPKNQMPCSRCRWIRFMYQCTVLPNSILSNGCSDIRSGHRVTRHCRTSSEAGARSCVSSAKICRLR
jgi:hypothetical protein